MIAEMSLVLDIDNSFQHEGPKGQRVKDLSGSFSLTLRPFDPLCRDKFSPLHALRESAIAASVAPARVLDLLAAALRAGGDHLLESITAVLGIPVVAGCGAACRSTV